MLFYTADASKETKEEKKSQSKWRNWNAAAPFSMLHHRAILYIVRTPGRRGGGNLFLFLSFLFLTKYRSSHQWCTLLITRRLFIKKWIIYMSMVSAFYLWLWTLFGSGWKLFTVSREGALWLHVVICHCVDGLSWRASKRKRVSF